MISQTQTIKATDVAPDLIHKVEEGAPHGWVTSIYQKILARVPESERDSIKVKGLENIVFTFEHVLTPVEEKELRLTKLHNALSQVAVKEYSKEEVEQVLEYLKAMIK